MKRWIRGSWLLVFAFACGEDDPVQLDEPIEVLTYNVGLAAGNVPMVDLRSVPVTDALVADSADVLCVQELWNDNDYAYLAGLDAFAHTQRLPANDEEGVACIPGELDPLAACVEAMCPTAQGDALGICATNDCGEPFGALAPGCLGCASEVVMGSATSSPMDVRSECEGTEGSRYIYGGTYDVAILSRLPVTAHESLVLDSYLVTASVEYAQVQTPTGGGVHVFCTHLASPFRDIPYGGEFGSWESEQQHQADQLVGFIEERVASGDHVIVAGDLNTGPMGTGYEAIRESIYRSIVDRAELDEGFATSAAADCTSCLDNTFRLEASRATLVDHVLLGGDLSLISAERTYTETVALSDEIDSHLSDHYGVRVVVGPGE
ncbi:MAG: endonuclease/exonuclease/phosphatase family protein [Deltaproteobacteria bacterium]|nr:endonuclease/exonuclease/phosphatase family protein [Deltaproteobacteria bacterium]